MVEAALAKVCKFILGVPRFNLWANHCQLIISACTKRVGNSLFMPVLLLDRHYKDSPFRRMVCKCDDSA